MLERFQEASRAIGCYRHLTSLAANALVAQDPERYADVTDWNSGRHVTAASPQGHKG